MQNPEAEGQRSDFLLSFLPENPGRVLDIGCGTGIMADEYRRRGATEVAGIEISPEKARAARWRMDRVICGDAATAHLPFPHAYFDTIICSEFFEFATEPWAAARRLAGLLHPEGRLLATISNAANYILVLNLISGTWPYADWGITNRSRIRYFTLDTAREMFMGAGLYPEVLSYSVTPEGESLLDRIDPDQIRFAVISMFKALNPNLDPAQLETLDPLMFFAYQYFIRATRRPPGPVF